MNWIFISLLLRLPAASWCAPKFPDEGIHVNSEEEHLEGIDVQTKQLKRIEDQLKGIEDKIDAVSEVIVEDVQLKGIEQLNGIEDKIDAVSEVILEDEPVKSKDQLTETRFKADSDSHLTEIDVKSENNHLLEGIDEKATDNHILEGIDDKATDNHILDGINEKATDHLLELIDERDTGIHLLDIHVKTVEGFHNSGDDVKTEEEHLSQINLKSEQINKINERAVEEDISNNGTKADNKHATGMDNGTDTSVKTNEQVHQSEDDVKTEEEHISQPSVKSEENNVTGMDEATDTSVKTNEEVHQSEDDVKTEEELLSRLGVSPKEENLSESHVKTVEAKENNLVGTRLTVEEVHLSGDDVVIEEDHNSLLDVESEEDLSKINIRAVKEDLSGLSTKVDEEYIKDENLVEIDIEAKEFDQEGVDEMIVNIFNPEEDLTEVEVANQTDLDSIQVQEADPLSPVLNDNIAALNESDEEVGEGQYGILMSRLMDMVGVGDSRTNPTDIDSKNEVEQPSENDVKTEEDLSEDDVNMISHIYMSNYEDLAGSNDIAEEDNLSEIDEIAEDPTENDATVEEKDSSEIGLVEQSKAFVGKLLDMIGLRNSATSPAKICSPSSPLYYTDLSDPTCKNFYHCSDGHSPSLISCSSGTRWSPKLHTCDHEENVPCPRTTTDDISVARCEFKGHGTGEVFGEVLIIHKEDVNGSHFQGKIIGLTPGLHGFHVHAVGDLGDDCDAAGGHFNPEDVNHGGKDGDVRHVGDLGNIEAEQSGYIQVDLWDSLALLKGTNSIIGKAIVVHEGEDDEGLGGDEGSLVHGNAGARAGCCIIEEV